MRNSSGLDVIDLFAGCGGFSLGFQNVGFNLVAAFDNWQAAIKVYCQNFSHPIYKVDLGSQPLDYTLFTQLKPLIIIGGPPCQDFSHAGKRNENLGRADLTISFAQIVVNLKPQFFVMENVDRAMRSDRLAIARNIFKTQGYGLTERILDASLCGVPQKRKRMFLIGGMKLEDDFLGCYLDSAVSKQPLTVRQYFNQNLQQDLDFQYYYRHPRNYSRRAIYSVDEPSATIRGVNRPIPSTYVKHPADATHSSDAVRPLTMLERAKIQTFPESFSFLGTKSEIEQMIGNAVPVKLAEYVARAILTYILQPTKPSLKQTVQLNLFESFTTPIRGN